MLFFDCIETSVCTSGGEDQPSENENERTEENFEKEEEKERLSKADIHSILSSEEKKKKIKDSVKGKIG